MMDPGATAPPAASWRDARQEERPRVRAHDRREAREIHTDEARTVVAAREARHVADDGQVEQRRYDE